MSDGFIGATDSVQYCIPNDNYSSIDICDEEYHAYDRGDGYYGCVAPSILPCNQADLADNGSADASIDGDACSFTSDGMTVSGVCNGGPGSWLCPKLRSKQ